MHSLFLRRHELGGGGKFVFIYIINYETCAVMVILRGQSWPNG